MSVQDKDILLRLWQAWVILPPAKQEYLLGYAEGVIASTQPAPPPQPQAPAPGA